ncbi:MAG: hypothetical protein HY553_21085 [Elusimicrobia bacterium]|nr:hypothetical protein [Elusimicrobiota bacterium]
MTESDSPSPEIESHPRSFSLPTQLAAVLLAVCPMLGAVAGAAAGGRGVALGLLVGACVGVLNVIATRELEGWLWILSVRHQRTGMLAFILAGSVIAVASGKAAFWGTTLFAGLIFGPSGLAKF